VHHCKELSDRGAAYLKAHRIDELNRLQRTYAARSIHLHWVQNLIVMRGSWTTGARASSDWAEVSIW